MGVHVDVTLGNVAVGGLLHVNPFAQSHGDGSFTGLIGFLQFLLKHHANGMQIALTVDQAAKAGIIPYTSDLPASFFKAADSQKERVLLDSYSDQKAKIDELKTAKAKATHWNRYLNTLKEYEDQYSMNPDSEYPEVLEQVKGELAKLDLSTSVPPSNP